MYVVCMYIYVCTYVRVTDRMYMYIYACMYYSMCVCMHL